MYQAGEVDFLVATDAIGMGLNMDINHVAFAGDPQVRWRKATWPHPAGDRPRLLAVLAVSCATAPLASLLMSLRNENWWISAVENHRFDPLTQFHWRAARLSYAIRRR